MTETELTHRTFRCMGTVFCHVAFNAETVEAEIALDGQSLRLETGESVITPAGVTHSVRAVML